MQFSTMYQEVAAQTGLDYTNATILAELKLWINITQQDIAGRWAWNFLRSRENIETVIDKSAGTVSVSSASTAVVGLGTSFAAGDVGKFIQFAGTTDWYRITAVTNTTNLTIDNPYGPTTNLSAGAYTIRQFFYSLSSSADSIVDIRNWNTPIRLVSADILSQDSRTPSPSSGTTQSYITYGYDVNGNIQIQLNSFPNDVRLLEVRTRKRLTDLSADSDVSVIPAKWHHAIIYGANALGFMYIRRPDMATAWKTEYESKIEDMISKDSLNDDESMVLGSVDSGQRNRYIKYPDGFPVS